jgi:GNAT superfamily N-acetyltransferase
MIIRIEDTKKVSALFGEWQESMIWSCMQKVMGSIYADDDENPRSAMAILGDFCCFAGKPNKELVTYKPNADQEFIIMVPQDEGWERLIEDAYGERCKRVTRYATQKEGDVFDAQKLKEAVNALDSEYQLKMIDHPDIFYACREHEWSRDLVSNYLDYTSYEELGIGVVAMKGEALVAGASAYSRYKEGIEIEVDTREDYRRKGLAYACGAKLILACMERGLYPSWDAHNKMSIALAEKLGYHRAYDYVAYEICY